jgi:hypothetical protein
MIWHIFWKDWKLAWRLPTVVAAVQIARGAILFKLGHFGDDSSALLLNLLCLMSFLGGAFCIAAAVQLDAIPGVRQDWLVRPLERRDLLLAKLLFVILAVQLPVVATDFVECLADGFPAGQSMMAAGSRGGFLLAGFCLPVLAMSSLTKNLLEFIVGGVTASLGLAMLELVATRSPLYGATLSSGVSWPAELACLMLGLAGTAAVLWLQYFSRTTGAACSTAGATLVLCLLAALTPWRLAFAIQQRRSPVPGGARAVGIAFDTGREPQAPAGRVSIGMPDTRGRYSGNVTVFLPLLVEGLPDDVVLKSDRCDARLIGPDGMAVNLGRANRIEIRNEGHGGGIRRAEQSIEIGGLTYERFKSQPVQIEIEYSLTLFGLAASHAVAALNGDQRIPDLGWCQSQINKSGTSVRMNCIAPGKDPLCVTAFLEHITGLRNPMRSFGSPNYAPYFGKFLPDSIARFGVDLPFHDPSGLIQYPVNHARIGKSEIVLRIYRPRTHFTRRLVIPAIRFENWESARET